jgi:hypothetical protein
MLHYHQDELDEQIKYSTTILNKLRRVAPVLYDENIVQKLIHSYVPLCREYIDVGSFYFYATRHMSGNIKEIYAIGLYDELQGTLWQMINIYYGYADMCVKQPKKKKIILQFLQNFEGVLGGIDNNMLNLKPTILIDMFRVAFDKILLQPSGSFYASGGVYFKRIP